MKPLWITFFVGFAILFSFQNCQSPPHMDEINSNSQGSANLSANKVVLAEHRLSEVNLFAKSEEKIMRNGNEFSMISVKKIELQFDESGLKNTFVVINEATNEVKNLCLTSSLKNELQSILAGASICKKTASEKSLNQICTAVMIPAYASIHIQSEVFDLGAATDGCGTNSVDLCGSEADLLKGFIQHLSTQLAHLSCN